MREEEEKEEGEEEGVEVLLAPPPPLDPQSLSPVPLSTALQPPRPLLLQLPP